VVTGPGLVDEVGAADVVGAADSPQAAARMSKAAAIAIRLRKRHGIKRRSIWSKWGRVTFGSLSVP
jgi:hypothetical protein